MLSHGAIDIQKQILIDNDDDKNAIDSELGWQKSKFES